MSQIQFVPTYDLTVERSHPSMIGERYTLDTRESKNIWYISIPRSPIGNHDFCVNWVFATETKRECSDHDGVESDGIFSFPVLSQPTQRVEFSLEGVTPDIGDITVYSIDTRASGTRISLRSYQVIAQDSIISRAEWGADETMRYSDSIHWKGKYESYLQYVQNPKTQAQLDAIVLEDSRIAYLIKNGGLSAEVVSLIRSEDGHPLVWPIERTKQVSRIVIHHTAQSMDSTKTDAEMIRGIYAYHTLSRQWGDIGYNYLIGQRGLIYEGRAGGSYTVGSHAAYNNMGTVGISVLGDYAANHLNRDQIRGTRSAISMMATRYGITLSDIKPGVKKCTITGCDLFAPITTLSLLGHRDVGHTDCPGSGIYEYIPQWIASLDRLYSPVYNNTIGPIEPRLPDRIMNLTLISPKNNIPDIKSPEIVIPNTKYIGAKFRVKLSYPDDNSMTLSVPDMRVPSIELDRKKILSKIGEKIKVGIVGNDKLSIKIGERYYTGSTLRVSHSILRIDSWSRIPEWDKSGKYNDNLFRDTIRVIARDTKLVVINDLPLEWYLKGMGEVSNTDLTEKIKTIVVAARSYARWYMDPKNRKFNTSLYDGSDDPDVFQKYLGYSYELRSPNVSKMVDATRGQVITYSGLLIKPWYHSSSDGRTLSEFEYCQNNGGKKCRDTPYLQSITDPGSVGKTRAGHGVGISGIGATYWAQIGWDYKKIIQYYLKGVEIQRK